MRPAVLLVGGLDPTGEAGLARDITACHALGVHPCPVPSFLSVQTSNGVTHIHPTAASLMRDMIGAAWAEHRPEVMKVGALADAEQADTVVRTAADLGMRIVLDPVLASSSGTWFASPDDLRPIIDQAEIITPNEDETRALGIKDDPRIHTTTGGDTPGHHRGTGCRYASRVAALLALDVPVDETLTAAHRDLELEIALDAGMRDLTPDRAAHARAAARGLQRVLAVTRADHVPEVGSNFAYAMAGATGAADVIGLAGRITIAGDDRAVAGRLAFRGPHHTGRIALVLQEYPGPGARAARDSVVVMNHRFDEAFLAAGRAAGLQDVGFCREDEPTDAPSSMEWGVRHCIEKNRGDIPDLIWDRGGDGKEPMIRVVATDMDDLVAKLQVLHRARPIGDPDGPRPGTEP